MQLISPAARLAYFSDVTSYKLEESHYRKAVLDKLQNYYHTHIVFFSNKAKNERIDPRVLFCGFPAK